MQNNIVSAIITAYNKERTIKRAIDSILNQTYHSLEIIVIEDKSTDGTLSRCQEYNNDINLVCHKENKGLYLSRLEAIKYAQGDFITFVDADDWLEPNAIFQCITTNRNSQTDIVQMKMNRCLSKWNVKIPISNKYNKNQAIDSCLYDQRIFPVSCCGKLYRKDLLMQAEYIDFNGFWGEDRILNLAIYNQKPKTAINYKAIYNYQWGGESVNSFNKDVIRDYVSVFNTKKKWAIKNGYEQFLPKMEQELTKLLLYYVRHMIDTENYTKNEIITFLGYELSNTTWQELGDLPSPEKIYSKCYNSIPRILKKKLRSHF